MNIWISQHPPTYLVWQEMIINFIFYLEAYGCVVSFKSYIVLLQNVRNATVIISLFVQIPPKISHFYLLFLSELRGKLTNVYADWEA